MTGKNCRLNRNPFCVTLVMASCEILTATQVPSSRNIFPYAAIREDFKIFVSVGCCNNQNVDKIALNAAVGPPGVNQTTNKARLRSAAKSSHPHSCDYSHAAPHPFILPSPTGVECSGSWKAPSLSEIVVLNAFNSVIPIYVITVRYPARCYVKADHFVSFYDWW